MFKKLLLIGVSWSLALCPLQQADWHRRQVPSTPACFTEAALSPSALLSWRPWALVPRTRLTRWRQQRWSLQWLPSEWREKLAFRFSNFPKDEVGLALEKDPTADLTPLLQAWTDRLHKSPWRVRIIDRLLPHPAGTQQYRRNRVYFTTLNGQPVDLYLHIWRRDGGTTRQHDHGDRRVYIAPWGEGMVAENFSLSPEDEALSDQRPVRFKPEPGGPLSAWSLSSIDPGLKDFHIVRNEASQDRIVAELYVGPRVPLAVYDPVEDQPGWFVRNHIPKDDFSFALGESLPKGAIRLSPAEAGLAVEDIEPSRPAYTLEGTALVTPQEAEDYQRRTNTVAYRSVQGPLFLAPDENSRASVEAALKRAQRSKTPILLEWPDGRVIRGTPVKQYGTRVTLQNAKYVTGDFSEKEGLVEVSLNPLPHPIQGIGDAILLDDYLRQLPGPLAKRVRRAYFPRAGRASTYIEQVLELTQQVERARTGSPRKAKAEAALRELKSFGLRYSDGLVRPALYHTPAAEVDAVLQKKWGTDVADVLVIGGGPAGIQAAGHAVAFGEKVILLTSQTLMNQWTRRFMAYVPWMRSDEQRTNGNWLAGPPKLESATGSRYGGVPRRRLLGEEARAQEFARTGRAFVGLPAYSDTLEGPHVLKAPPATNEFFGVHLEQAAFIQQHGLIQEETRVVSRTYEAAEGLYHVFTADGHVYKARHIHFATGTVGDEAQYARLPTEGEVRGWGEDFELIRSAADTDNPEVLRRLLEKESAHWVLPAALSNAPEWEAVITRLKAGRRVTIFGDGETAAKTAIRILSLNPGVSIYVIVKKPLANTPRTLSAEMCRRLEYWKALADGKLLMENLTEDERRGGLISPQTEKDFNQRLAEGRIRVHLLSETDAAALVDGPVFYAGGYLSASKRLRQDPLLSEDELQPLAERGYLAIGRPGGPYIYYNGNVITRSMHETVTGVMAVRAVDAAIDRAKRYGAKPAQRVLTADGEDQALTPAENAVWNALLGVLHDPEFSRLLGATAAPRWVYAPLPLTPGDQPVSIQKETDPVRHAHLDLVLAGEANVEVIPGLANYLADLPGFIDHVNAHLREAARNNGHHLFARRVDALSVLVRRHPQVDLSRLAAHAGLTRRVIYMDANDYETLFSDRSSTRITQADIPGERGQLEFLIVQILQRLFSHITSEGLLPVAILERFWSPLRAEAFNLLEKRRSTARVIAYAA